MCHIGLIIARPIDEINPQKQAKNSLAIKLEQIVLCL